MRFAWCQMALLFFGSAAHGADPTNRMPVYIHLFTRLDDHLNIEHGDRHLRHLAGLLREIRKEHPEFKASVTVSVTGAVSVVLGELNAANHTVDFVKEAAARGELDLGYDGEAEPTELTRPRANFRSAKTPEARWLARSEALNWFLTEFKDLIWGEPDPSRSGGLKKTQELFGEVALISRVTRELGGEPELVHLVRQWNQHAVLSGLAEGSTYPARYVHGYGGSVAGIGAMMAPAPEFAPELYWQDNYLRLSDTSGPSVRSFNAADGPEALQKSIERIDRSRIHILRVHLGSDTLRLKPEFLKAWPVPVHYSYASPKEGRLPASAFRTPEELEASQRKEEAVVRWLSKEFFPANPGSRFVMASDLRRMAKNNLGSRVSRQTLVSASADLLRRWKGNFPAAYASAGDDYFSLADMFHLLVNSYAEIHRAGTLPDSLVLSNTYGPIDMTDEPGPNVGETSIAALSRASAQIAPSLNDQTWKPVPSNAVPGWVSVAGTKLNAAQFLRLLAQGVSDPSPNRKLKIEMCEMQSEAGLIFPTMFRRPSEKGATWTLKPASLPRQ